MPQIFDTQTNFFHLFQLLLASLDATHSQEQELNAVLLFLGTLFPFQSILLQTGKS